MYLLVGWKENRLSGYPREKLNLSQFTLELTANLKALSLLNLLPKKSQNTYYVGGGGVGGGGAGGVLKVHID